MNLELMKAVSAAIKAHPHHFNMSEWYRHDGGSLDDDSCGTRACLAGWTLHCAGAEDAVRALLVTGRVPAAALDELGLSGDEREFARQLFHLNWPIDNWADVKAASNDRALAVWDTWIALERICRLTYDVDGNLVPAEQ